MGFFENLVTQFLGTVNTATGFNPKVAFLIMFLVAVGEAYLNIPLFIESLWLALGYQAGAYLSAASLTNLVVAFVLAQAARQTAMLALYNLVPVINSPLSRIYLRPLQRLRQTGFYRNHIGKYLQSDYFSELKFLSLSSSLLGMLTPLNTPLKIALAFKRKLKVLLIATLISGMIFDTLYITLGAVFHITTLNLTYLPLCLLVGFLSFTFMRWKVLK